MEIKFITITAVFSLCFLSAFSVLKTLCAICEKKEKKVGNYTFFPLYLLSFAGFLLIFYTIPQTTDFIFPLTATEIGIAAAGTLLTEACFRFFKQKFFRFITVFLAAGTLSFFCADNLSLFETPLPFCGDRIILVLTSGAFVFCILSLNSINALPVIQLIFSALGIFILSLLGGAPEFLGLMCWVIIGVLVAVLIFTLSPLQLQLNSSTCAGLTFITLWLIMKSAGEGAAPNNFIFNIFCLYSAFFAALQRFALSPEKQNPSFNTCFYLAFSKGMPPYLIRQIFCRGLVFLIIIGAFQTYAPNNFSVPILSLITAVWFDNCIRSWSPETINQSDTGKDN